ncbi:hypothetical protein [Azospirillum largimobile]
MSLDHAAPPPPPARMRERWWTNRALIPAAVVAAAAAGWLSYEVTSRDIPPLNALGMISRTGQGTLAVMGFVAGVALHSARWIIARTGLSPAGAYFWLDVVLNMAVAAAAAGPAALVLSLFWWFPGIRPRNEFEAMRPRSGARAVTRQILVTTILFILLIHAVQALANWFGDDGAFERTIGFFWGGILLMALVFWARTPGGVAAKRLRGPAGAVPASVSAALPKLFQAYVKAGAGKGLLFSDERQVGDLSSARRTRGGFVPSERLGAALDRFVQRTSDEMRLSADEARRLEQFLVAIGRNDIARIAGQDRPNVNVYFEEPLGELHFRALAETVSLSQDEGGATLVLCPDLAYGWVKRSLWRVFGEHCTDVTQTWWGQDDGKFDPTTIPSLLLVTHEGLQQHILGRSAADFDRVLERLRLIVLIDVHRFDPSLLHQHLALLWMRVPAERVRVIAQGAPRAAARDLHEDLFRATGRTWQEASLRSEAATKLYTLVWDRTRAARDALLNGVVANGDRDGIDLVPLLLLPALRLGNDCVYLDAWERKEEVRWGELEDRLQGGVSISKVRTEQQPVFGREPTVALIEDRGNLHDSLLNLYQAQLPAEFLVLVASHAYPLRDFLLDPERMNRAIQGSSNSPFHPIAPRPRGGLRELALVVLLRLLSPPAAGRNSRAAVLTRMEAARHFDALGNPALLRAFKVSPTRHGIETLLKIQFPSERLTVEMDRRQADQTSATPSLASGSDVDDDVRYFCAGHSQLPEAMKPFIPLTDGGVNKQEVGWVARDDHGLAFVAGTAILVRGRHYLVTRVSNAEVAVQAFTDLRGRFHVGGSVGFRFWRLYRLLFDERTVLAEAPRREWIGIGRTAMLFHAPLERATVGYEVTDTLGGTARPDAMTVRLNGDSMVRRDLQSVNVAAFRYHVTQADGTDPSRIAFTLAALLGDLLETLFPALGHRVAVLSPQAGPVVERLQARSRDDKLAEVLLQRYPRMTASPSSGYDAPPVPAADVQDAVGRLIDGAGIVGADMRSGVSGPNAGPNGGEGGCCIDLLVVEDWPADLGVARAVYAYSAQVERALALFATWLAGKAEEETLFYRFGTDRLPDAFDFQGAAHIAQAAANMRAGGEEAP